MGDNESSSKNIQWMYEGTKSMVNREDYLLGKKIDKNFELFSDVVVKDKDEEERDDFFRKSLLQHPSTSSSAPHKVSALDTRVVRTEDPLVALKFQEEQRKRHLLDNPLLKLKAQRVLRKAFEKELKKEEKSKKKKKDKNRRKRTKSSSSVEEEDRMSGRRRTRSRSSERSRSRSHRRSRSKSDRRSPKSDQHHHRHRHHRHSSSSNGQKLQQGGGKDGSSAKSKSVETMTKSSRMVTKLTAEELEKRRQAMLDNATWRNEMRESNLREAAEKLQKEREEQEGAKGPSFIRPLINSATEGSSLEKRLQSNRMNIQRQHDHMDKSFTKK